MLQFAASVKKPLPVVIVQKPDSEEKTLPDKITRPGNSFVKAFLVRHLSFYFDVKSKLCFFFYLTKHVIF